MPTDRRLSIAQMFLGSPNKVYIIDKVEGNAHQVGGHSAFASVWDLNTRTATPVDAQTNPFCAGGMHLPNGSYAVFGGNPAIGPGGDNSAPNSTQKYDPYYDDYDGTRAIRMITPCDGDLTAPPCAWDDSQNGLQMLKHRWYPGVEPLADGSVVLIGGFRQGGYINREYPNLDPTYEVNKSEPTYEFFPPTGQDPPILKFVVDTSGLNSFPLTYLMPSGKMFVQANYSTMLWDYNTNTETRLPDMPGRIIRVYPGSAANAMLPLTPANNYNPTILFCGGTTMADELWGDYDAPNTDTWTIEASKDCQQMTPEPADGSSPVYVQDDPLSVGRVMGQFIALPDGTLLLLNGAQYGTAGYTQGTKTTPSYADLPYGQSLATGPILQPMIYNPNAPAGSRWSSAGLSASTVPRMYHSTALLLPDASIMIAGSNPNADANVSTKYPTTYIAEYLYPSYFSASTRPVPQGIPKTLSYGGDPFNITLSSSSYTGSADDAASKTTVWLIRQGFTTHAMNMGQRSMQLQNTFTVQKDGTIIIHTAQPHPIPALFQPGPAFVYVTIAGIPSNGTYVIVGSGQVGKQPTAAASVLPPSAYSNASSSGSGSGSGDKGGASPSHSAVSSARLLVSLVAVVVLALAFS
jgi:hypothetical protein